MPALLFPDYPSNRVSEKDIHWSLLVYGCCLIRKAFTKNIVKKLASEIDAISKKKSWQVKCGKLTETFARFHITENEYKAFYPGQSLYDILSEKRWNNTLEAIFGCNQFYQHPETYTRGIDARPEVQRDLTSFRPLQFHLDTIYHPPLDKFAINFWIPFDNCGVIRPGIQLVPINHVAIRRVINFKPEVGFSFTEASIDESQWSMKNTWQRIAAAIPDSIIWRPRFSIGDLLIMSSWLPHASYTTENMPLPRRSVELRYYGNALDPLPLCNYSLDDIQTSFFSRYFTKKRKQNYIRIHELRKDEKVGNKSY